MALRFVDRHSGQLSMAPRFIDDDTLVASLWRTLSAHGLLAQVTVGSPSLAQGRDRRTWAVDLQREIESLRAPKA
jgi:1-acyl-sn-glycerol-3-phosphate acyltransferase